MNTLDFDTYTAELEYRTDRIRREVGRNKRRVRLPFTHRYDDVYEESTSTTRR
jgi:hypothetical protein